MTPEATLEALAYLISNPVEAVAVRYARDWPGACTKNDCDNIVCPESVGAP